MPCFTPIESPESNGMAEAFVKPFKRGYVRVSPIPDAAAARALSVHGGARRTEKPAFLGRVLASNH
jgi:hypothetical protein